MRVAIAVDILDAAEINVVPALTLIVTWIIRCVWTVVIPVDAFPPSEGIICPTSRVLLQDVIEVNVPVNEAVDGARADFV